MDTRSPRRQRACKQNVLHNAKPSRRKTQKGTAKNRATTHQGTYSHTFVMRLKRSKVRQSSLTNLLQHALCYLTSCLITVMVHLVAKAAIAPKAASQGANNVPTIPAQAGISKRVLPSSSFTMILDMSPS